MFITKLIVVKQLLLKALLLIANQTLCQIDFTDPYDYLNTENQPKIFTQNKISKHEISGLIIRHQMLDEYDTTRLRTRIFQKTSFNDKGLITSIRSVDSAQVFDKSKEKFWGKLKMTLGQKNNMIWTVTRNFYYNENGLLDSCYYWEDSYVSTENYHAEMTSFEYDDIRRLIFQKTVNQEYWGANSKDNDTNIAAYSIKYKGITDEYDTLFIFKEDWGSADLYDTVIGNPKPTYHIGYYSPQVEIGQNGFVKKITTTHLGSAGYSRGSKLPETKLFNKYVLFYYSDDDILEYTSHLDSDLIETHQTRFLYNENGFLIKKIHTDKNGNEIPETYTYIK